MSQFIHKRHNTRNKSAINRHRFLQRFKRQIRKAVDQAVVNRSITDFEHGEKVHIPTKDTNEPTFHHGEGGIRAVVLPGNKDFSRGDKIARPTTTESASGNQASNTGEGEDPFSFDLSREEFLDVFFDDLELPNLLKKQLETTKSMDLIHAGFTSDGVPANINIVRSMRNALARRIALGTPYKRKIKTLEEQLAHVEAGQPGQRQTANDLEAELELYKGKIKKIPFIDPFDVRYNRRVVQPSPAAKAVMFCLMDVSGSMDEIKKDLAKRFFVLLYLFLKKTYETIDVVFIRHHTSAKEVNENDFFFSKETGGTVVSSALELMSDIIHDRYPSNEWNIYGAQASDGDNWNNDSPHCKDLLMSRIMPFVQYYAYVEILPRHHQSLWEEYETVKAAFPHFAMQTIDSSKDIYPVFRELFKRQTVTA